MLLRQVRETDPAYYYLRSNVMNKEQENPIITVTGRHVEVTEAMNVYVEKKVNTLHTDFLHIKEAKVVLDVQGKRQIAEIVLFCNGHITIRACSESPDLYASIDETIGKIARRMRKNKTRIMKKYRPHHQETIRGLDEKIFSEDILDGEANEQDDPEPMFIHREGYKVRTMYKEEAMMDLELSEKPFILYRNARRNVLQIVFKRSDGDYCIIELGENL